jgi:membrane associated rhomboid family serine protease
MPSGATVATALPAWMPVMALLGTLALLLAHAVRARRRAARADRRRILADGASAAGAVMHVSPPDDLGHCTVTIGFDPAGGAPHVSVEQPVTAGVIPALRLAPGTPLEVRYRRDRPALAFAPTLALAEYSQRPGLAPAAPECAAWYPVAFEDPDGGPALLQQSAFHWTGGEVVVDDSSLEIRGLRARAFRPALLLSRRFAFETVQNVEVAGHAVAFELQANGSGTPLRLWLADAAAAIDLASRLPTTRTADFRPGLDAGREFERHLVARRPTTPVTTALVAANLLVFVLAAASGAGWLRPNGARLVLLGSNYTPLTLGGQPWRLLSSTFLHFGLLHVLLVMGVLWLNGRVAERLYGSVRYLLIYLVAGIGASTASVLWHPFVHGAGASGALFGVLGATLAFLARRPEGIAASFLRTQRLVILLFIATTVLFSLRMPSIDQVAHLGGLVTGFVLGYLLARPLDGIAVDVARERQQALGLALASVAVVVVAMLGGPTTEAISATVAGGVPGIVPHPSLTTFAGIRIGATRAEVEATHGAPLETRPGTSYYGLGPAASRARLEVTYHGSAAAPAATDRVGAVLYHGDKAQAPPELLYVSGQWRDRLVADFGQPAWQLHANDGVDYEMYADGLTVELRGGRVRAYGLQDFYKPSSP